MSNVEELKVFQDAHALTLSLYSLTNNFPQEEKFGLISQIRSAGASIGASLMEGSHRNNRKEYRQFVGIARASAGELKYHLLLARDLKYINETNYLQLIAMVNNISKMLFGLSKALDEK